MSNKNKEWRKTKAQHYGKDEGILEGKGTIIFARDSLEEVVGGEKLTYDEYLDVQYKSVNEEDYRAFFDLCYTDAMYHDFYGTVTRKDKDHVLFNRIYISGMYPDGIGFEGREHHVWMDVEPFAAYEVGTCLHFEAEVYRYLKLSQGKSISLGLRNPTHIEITDAYRVPTDEDLINQELHKLACEVCLFNDHCYMEMCLAAPNYEQEMIDYLKEITPGKFTPFTVMAAYEKAGLVVTQMVEKRLLALPEDVNHPLSKMVFESWLHPSPCRMDFDYAMTKIFWPEHRRMYFE